MSEPQSYKNTNILINGIEYNALVSTTRSEVTTDSTKFYNYRGEELETGGGTVEYGDLTIVFAERDFDQLRTDLNAIDTDGYFVNDLNDYPFTMSMKIEPNSTYATAKKEIFYPTCRIKSHVATEIVKGNNYFTVSTTVSVDNVKERVIS